MLTVLTPAVTTDLTTIATVKADLGISGTTDDAVLADLVKRASSAIATHTGRNFGRETVRETIRLDRPVPSIALSRLPVVDIASVSAGATTLVSAAYEADKPAGLLRRLDARKRYLCWDADVLTVDYTAGFLLPGENGRDLPDDVEGAAVALVRHHWYARGRDSMARQVTLGDASVSYFGAATGIDDGLPVDIASMLARYRLSAVG